VAFVHGSRQRSGAAPEVAAEPTVQVECPSGTAKPERAIWKLHAADAIKAGTLTPQTARSFVQLVCEPRAVYNRVAAAIKKQGLTFWQPTESGRVLKKHPLITDLNNWHRRVDNGHKQFALAPMGKPVAAAAKPKELSALEKLQAQALTMRRLK
jgi:hypothetical protein